MKTTRNDRHKPSSRLRNGFTLVEVITGLILSASLIALMLPLIGSSLKGGRDAVRDLPQTQNLRSDMDALWQLYRTNYIEDLEGLAQRIAQTNSSESYTLLENMWVDFNDQGWEITPNGDDKNVLRVTIGNDDGERLTTYFFPIH